MAKQQDYGPLAIATEIKDVETKWYCPDLLPMTGLVLIVGPPGQGKTTASCSILADISAGRLPISGSISSKREVVIFSREEMPSAIKVRMGSLGADLAKVRISDQHDLRDAPRIRNIIENGAAAIIVDSLTAFTEGNLNSRREMFAALDCLRRVAEPRPERSYAGALILLIHHTNSRSGSISDRTAGSKAIMGVIRHALHVGSHPFDSTQRVLSVAKSNISAIDGNRTFTLSPFKWGDELDASSSELLGGGEFDNPNRAAEWLMRHMRPGIAYAASQLFAAASDSKGLSRRSLQRAAKYLHINTERFGFGGQVFWTYGENADEDVITDGYDDQPQLFEQHQTRHKPRQAQLFVMPNREEEL